MASSTRGNIRTASKSAAVADVAALTSAAITGGEPPTEAEHNAVRADLVATRTTLNNLLAALRTAGILLPNA